MRRRLRTTLGRRRGQDERGAVAVFTAIVMVLLLLVGALALDLGMQRVVRRDMQAVADLVAFDLARQLDGRDGATILASGSWNAALRDSLARNDDNLGETPDVDIALGTVDPATYRFTPLSGAGGVPTAVRVTASSSVRFALSGVTGVDSGSATRSAVAGREQEACFRLGSYAARLDSSNSGLLTTLLNTALGGSVNLSAVGYQGLATSRAILLGDLAAELGLGTADELVATTVSGSRLFLAAANVLQRNGDTANAQLLRSLSANAGPSQVALGRLLSAQTGGTAAAAAGINALDLVAGSAFIARNGAAISIPGLSTSLGLTGTDLLTSVGVVQAPQLACGRVGRATARTSQVGVLVRGTLASVPALPSSILGLSASAGQTRIAVDLAGATGTLAAVQCGAATAASPEGVDVSVTSQLGTVTTLDQRLTVSGDLGKSLLGNLLGGLLGTIVNVKVSGSVDLSVRAGQVRSTRTASIRIPTRQRDYSVPASTGTGDLGLDQNNVTFTSNLQLEATGLLGLRINLNTAQIDQLTSKIVGGLVGNVVNPLLTRVNSSLITPLSSLLGVELAGADVYGVPRPLCSVPTLRG